MKHTNNVVWLLGATIYIMAGISGCTAPTNSNGEDSTSDSITEISDSLTTVLDSSSGHSLNPEIALSQVGVEIVDTLGLKIYYPNYSKIDLVCGEMPEKTDSTVIFMASAAYTKDCLDHFSHDNIIGNHVTGGKFYNGTSSKTYRGAFVYYNDTPKFIYHDWAKDLRMAAENSGCGFAQDMMIHDGEEVDHSRESSNVNEFRALCLIDGKVAVADSDGSTNFGDFISDLLKIGATEALYLDMGGWNYSWYRDDKGNVTEIHTYPNQYATNWITFYK